MVCLAVTRSSLDGRGRQLADDGRDGNLVRSVRNVFEAKGGKRFLEDEVDLRLDRFRDQLESLLDEGDLGEGNLRR